MADDEAERDSFREMFNSFMTDYVRDEDAKRERAKPPKDFGEAMDRLANRVWEVGEERAAARRKADEDADQEPSRSAKRSKFETFMFGSEEAS